MRRRKFQNLAKAILICLLASAVVIAGIWKFQESRRQSQKLPVEKALFVSDWEITNIFGPGTAEQEQVVKFFQSMGLDEFESPVLYRMGGNSGTRGNEGLLLIPFDPKNPEMALKLKATPLLKTGSEQSRRWPSPAPR